jgi:hypothetical protein
MQVNFNKITRGRHVAAEASIMKSQTDYKVIFDNNARFKIKVHKINI